MKRLNRWAKDQPILQFVVQMALVVLLTDATVETGLLRIEWLHDLVWFLVPIAWAAVSVALALFSKNMWDVIKARQEDRRQKMEDLEREREKERQHLEKERALREEKQHLAVKIWQDCKDDAVAIQVARDSGDIVQSRIKTAQLAGKLQGLDPFLDAYDSVNSDAERMWVWAVSEIIARTDPSAETLDRIRTKARVHLEYHDVAEEGDLL